MVNKYNALSIIALVVCIATPLAALANTEGKSHITVSDLDAIMQEEIVLKAKAARAKQRAELGQYVSEAQSAGATSSILPQVAWRRSTASGWLAKFILIDGASLIAGVGERLPGNFVIAQIDERGVKLKRDGEVMDLSAASSSAQRSTESVRADPAHPGSFRLPALQ